MHVEIMDLIGNIFWSNSEKCWAHKPHKPFIELRIRYKMSRGIAFEKNLFTGLFWIS